MSRFSSMSLALGLAAVSISAVVACSSATPEDPTETGASSVLAAPHEKRAVCGEALCGEGEVCCNDSCGICTAPGGACIQLLCAPEPPPPPPPPATGPACGEGTCAVGLECCNPSCGICTPPGGACTQQLCAPEPPPPPPPPAAKCVVSGCSGEVCADVSFNTTCEFRPEDACYQGAQCTRQGDGACGWTPTPKLLGCLAAQGGAN